METGTGLRRTAAGKTYLFHARMGIGFFADKAVFIGGYGYFAELGAAIGV